MPELLLRAKGIAKTFSGVRALQAANFELELGEVHALVGENGAGKSTLIKIITGAVPLDAGSLQVAGRDVLQNHPRLAKELGVVAIYQQPSLFPDLSVSENIALALETGGMWRSVDWRARRARAQELLDRAGAAIDPETPARSLSMPEQQLVEIAKAIGAKARILIMDEPTSSLTQPEVERLFRAIQVFRGDGAGIVYISHRMEEIFAIADRITVLRDGKTVVTRRTEQVNRDEIIHWMVGREISAVFPKKQVPIGEIALELRRLSNGSAGLRDISVHVRKGEILGIAGLVGAGRTELAETIFGLRPAHTGEILVHGKPVRIGLPSQAIEHGIAYVPEDRRRHGIVMEMPISSNVSLADLSAVSRRGLVDRRIENDLAQRYMGQLRIKAESIESEVAVLSGGNQQKVALARWLATNPSILILDEPTQGVDIASKREIHKLMVELAERGMAIVLISSEIPEILGMTDRIAVMQSGCIRGVLARQDATPQRILSLALGHQ
ncbi:MAG TPA: sugar ABC transporter ATP-binding protein [Bryobacteraceae bacterium]